MKRGTRTLPGFVLGFTAGLAACGGGYSDPPAEPPMEPPPSPPVAFSQFVKDQFANTVEEATPAAVTTWRFPSTTRTTRMPSTISSHLPEALRRGPLRVGAVIAALAAAVALIDTPATTGSPTNDRAWIPDSRDAIVLQLEGAGGVLTELASLREELQQRPGDAAAAARYGRLALRHYAQTGDARFLGYAAGAIRYWRHDREPPQPVWILRARVLQTEHYFGDAAQELLRMLAVHGDSAEALLLAADALRRAGDVAAAKSICLRLGLTGHALLARYCAADVLLSLGQAEQAFAAVSAEPVPTQDALRQWALTVRADAAAAAGQTQVAEALYREALALPDAGIALRVSHADLLLDSARPEEALRALEGLPAADAVLLRTAIAAARLQRPEADRLSRKLRRRFAEAATFGFGRLHLREQAMFALFVDNDAEAALELAVANWEVQKGFEDAELLVQAATAAGQLDEVRAIDRWRRQFADPAR